MAELLTLIGTLAVVLVGIAILLQIISLEEILGFLGRVLEAFVLMLLVMDTLRASELPRLSWDARWAIIDRASVALSVSVGDRARFRIAAISDGFPHYVHLVCEKLFWEMFEDPQPCVTADNIHYTNAVAAAVLGIEQRLKQAYDGAILQHNDGYEEVLWAVADHSDLIRRSDSIFDSYSDIMTSLDRPPLARPAFTARLRNSSQMIAG